jgi:hypothetical protein
MFTIRETLDRTFSRAFLLMHSLIYLLIHLLIHCITLLTIFLRAQCARCKRRQLKGLRRKRRFSVRPESQKMSMSFRSRAVVPSSDPEDGDTAQPERRGARQPLSPLLQKRECWSVQPQRETLTLPPPARFILKTVVSAKWDSSGGGPRAGVG